MSTAIHTRPDTDSAIELAEVLLVAGHTVGVITTDTAPLAMLVNRYGDRFQAIGTDGTIDSNELAAEYAAAGDSEDEVLIVVTG